MNTLYDNIITNFQFIKDNWEILTYTLSGIFIIIKKLITKLNLYKIRQEKSIKNLELMKEYFSIESIKKLDQESKIIQQMTCNIIPFLQGFTYKEIKKLINADIQDNNFYIFLELYRSNYLDIKGKLKPNAKIKIKHAKWLKWVYILLFLVWLTFLVSILSKYYPLPFTLFGWILLFIGVGIPEALLLGYLEKIKNLKKFE